MVIDPSLLNLINILLTVLGGAYGALGAVSAANVAGFTWNAAQNIVISQNSAANNHIVVYALIVDIFPKGIM